MFVLLLRRVRTPVCVLWDSFLACVCFAGAACLWQVNGAPTRTLDELLAVVRALPAGAPVRVMVQEIRGKEQMVTLRPDDHYWPTVEVRRLEDGSWAAPEDWSTGL